MRRNHHLGALMLALVVAAGCGGRDTEADAVAVPLAGVSDPVRAAWGEQQRLLRSDGPPAPRAADVRRYYDLRNTLHDPARRDAAREDFFAIWTAQNDDPLWLELALAKRAFLRSDARFDSLLAAAGGRDTTRAAWHYAHARRNWGADATAPEHFRQAVAGAPAGSMLAVWAQLRQARIEADAGDVDRAVLLLTGSLPAAHQLGGPLLAASAWLDLSYIVRRAGRLGDALAAAKAADACAVSAGHGFLRTRARLVVGIAHMERREFLAAFDTFSGCAIVASDSVFLRWEQSAAAGTAQSARASGDVERELSSVKKVLETSVQSADTNSFIRSALALASLERRQGHWDSATKWFAEAEAANEAWTAADLGASIASEKAILLVQQGRYDEAQSLFEAAAGGDASDWYGRGAFDALLGLIRQGLETGRPDIVYPALARARTFDPDKLPQSANYDPLRSLEEIAARFHTLQGELHLADAALARARERLDGASPDAVWYFTEAEARLARAAGDLARAAASFAACEDVAVSLDNPDLVRSSRVQLGSVLMEQGRYAAAESLFAQDRDAPEFWNALNANLMIGMCRTRDGRPSEALQALSAADSLLGGDSAPDLLARLRVEQGKALSGLGRDAEALQALQDARDVRQRVLPAGQATEVGQAFGVAIDREIAEATLAVLWRSPELRPSRGAMDFVRAVAAAGRGGGAPDRPAHRARPRVEYFVGERRAFVWVLPAGGGAARWLELPEPARLAGLVEAARVDMSYPGRAVDAAAAAALGRHLLRPVLASWPEGAALEVLPDGPLRELPWAALPVGDEGGAHQVALERGPLVLVSERAARAPAAAGRERLLAMGQDAGDDGAGGGRLAAAEAEARAVADLWPGEADLRLGAAARWTDLRGGGGAGYRAVHIASHSRLYEGAEGQSCLYLAGQDDEPPLTLPEVPSLLADPELLYLSSCEGARRHRVAGRGVTSFADAFLAAGAGAVVASTILVDDAVAAAVAAAFYEHWLAGETKPAALRLALLETRAADERWRHPYYWAFVNIYEPAS